MVRPKQKTDEEILEAARECFFKNGISVSAQVIADHAGLSQPGLFKRFGTKEELVLRALAPPEHLPVFEWIEAAPAKGAFRPQLRELLEKVWETINWIFPRIMLLFASQFSPETIFCRYKTPPPLRLITAISGFLERAVQNGQIRSDIDTETMALSLFGVMQSRAFFRIILRADCQPEDAAYIDSVVDLLWRGMMPKKS